MWYVLFAFISLRSGHDPLHFTTGHSSADREEPCLVGVGRAMGHGMVVYAALWDAGP